MGSANHIGIRGVSGDYQFYDKTVGAGRNGSVLMQIGKTTMQIGDAGNGRTLNIYYSHAGGDSPKGIAVIAAALAGTKGLRQGAVNIALTRAAAQALVATWDGNPDTSMKVITRNYANNLDGATRIGGARALDIQARNSGTNLSWVKTMELNARNDSGKNVSELLGLHIRAENYGNVYTSTIGLDIELSDENTTQAQPRTGIQIRSTDGSGMSAVEQVFKISHSSTNGFTNLFKFNAATGDTYTAKVTAGGGDLGNTNGYIKVDINGTPGRIPVFDEWA